MTKLYDSSPPQKRRDLGVTVQMPCCFEKKSTACLQLNDKCLHLKVLYEITSCLEKNKMALTSVPIVVDV